MNQSIRTVITGTGSYIPTLMKSNNDFYSNSFFDEGGSSINEPIEATVRKFQQITGIAERRYAPAGFSITDMAAHAAVAAIADSGIDPETIDQLIVAHNFGSVVAGSIQSDAVPSIAARVKHALHIKNPYCIPYDILFGCPGWLQGLIHADAFIKAGAARNCLVIGAETLSRVIDIHDRDCMIFSDGAGACVVEAREDSDSGIMAAAAKAYTETELDYIYMGQSFNPAGEPNARYLKMKGRKVYEFAIRHVATAIKECLDKSGIGISQVSKVFLHQANEKMDHGIVLKLFKLYGIAELPPYIMPMSIHLLGNSSVATVPTLFDIVKRGLMPEHALGKGDIVVFASVGAGMNINALTYRI
jgi:3-oxoacyl-[acyl-carrier-protein] synthase-3